MGRLRLRRHPDRALVDPILLSQYSRAFRPTAHHGVSKLESRKLRSCWLTHWDGLAAVLVRGTPSRVCQLRKYPRSFNFKLTLGPVVARFRPPNKAEIASGGETIVDFETDDTCQINVCLSVPPGTLCRRCGNSETLGNPAFPMMYADVLKSPKKRVVPSPSTASLIPSHGRQMCSTSP